MSAAAGTPSNERAARWFLIAAFALVAIGCGSHFRLSRIQPNRTIRGNVLVASLREIGRRLPTAVSFVDARRGFVGTRGGQLLATADAGEHWRVVGRGRHVVSLSFVDRRNGFALTRFGTLIRTRDGGRTWILARRGGGAPGGPFAGAVQFVDARHGWLAAFDGRLYATGDGGRTWARIKTPCDFVLGGIALATDTDGYLVCGGQPATIMQEKELYTTADAGATWRLVAAARVTGTPRPNPNALPASGYAAGLAFATTEVGLLLTDRGGVDVTYDGGRTWRHRLFTDDRFTLGSASWATPTRIFATYVGGGSGGVLRSDDGGNQWRQLYPRDPGAPTGAIRFATRLRGTGVGTAGMFGAPDEVVSTADGGKTWRRTGLRRQPTRPGLGSIRSSHGERLSVRGDRVYWARRHGTPRAVALPPVLRILGLAAYGDRWWVFANRCVRRPRTAAAAKSYRGCARVGGVIFRSPDAGRHWDLIALPIVLDGEHVSFVTAKTGFLNDLSARLFRTDDGGMTWRQIVPR